MKIRIALAFAAATVCFSTNALAADGDGGRVSVGVTGGTLGIGPEIGFRLSNTVGLRANGTLLSISHHFDSDDITYDGKVKLQSIGAMVDVYPFGGGFRISGGLRYNGNKARAIAQLTGAGTYDINGVAYTAAQIGTLRGDTDIKNVAPALTLGYGGSMSSGFTLGIEAGALFQGRVRIKPLTLTGVCATNAATCPGLAANLEAERLSVQDDIDGYKVYPILQLSVGYRF